MKQLYDMGIRILFFCGGETFLWEDSGKTLRDLVIEAKQMGFLKMHDAVRIPNPDYGKDTLYGDKESRFILTTPGRRSGTTRRMAL